MKNVLMENMIDWDKALMEDREEREEAKNSPTEKKTKAILRVMLRV